MELKFNNPKYYVGVQIDNGDKDYHLCLITETDNATSTWKAEVDKKPKWFDKKIAEELAVCLMLNERFAVVVCSNGELRGQPFVKH